MAARSGGRGGGGEGSSPPEEGTREVPTRAATLTLSWLVPGRAVVRLDGAPVGHLVADGDGWRAEASDLVGAGVHARAHDALATLLAHRMRAITRALV